MAAWLALATSWHSHPDTHLEVDCPDGNDWKPSQTLVGTVFFPPSFSPFCLPSPPSQTLYIPPAITPSISHLMAFPLLSMGGSVCAWAVIFVNSRWNPCCNSCVGSFALLAFSGHSWGWDHAAFLWLWACGLWQPAYHTRYKRGSHMSCGVCVCTYNSGDAGCSGWIAVHIEYSEAEKQCEGIRPQHKNT